MSPYSPIDPNPDVDVDAGYMNADQPTPAPPFDQAQTPGYAMQPVSAGPPGTLTTLDPMLLIQKARPHVFGALFGVAGAALCCTGKSKTTKAALGKGAVAGLLACWLVSKKVAGPPCALAGVAGGYAIARFWR